jgi:uncharacterized membrane protein
VSNLIQGLLIGTGLVLIVMLILGIMGYGPSTKGIYAHTTGEAVYIAGEACVINDVPDIDFQEVGAWCNAQRADNE